MSTRVIKQWRLDDGTEITVLVNNENKVSYEVTAGDGEIIDVTGIPKEALEDSAKLEGFLSNTYVILGKLGNGKYHLNVHLSLNGGANIINPATEPARLWPGGVIPYEIDSNQYPVGDEKRLIILAAIAKWNEANTGFDFVPRTNQKDYLIFGEDPNACYSNVGHQGGAQRIRCDLHDGIFDKGSIMHEIGHALGFYHEQQRQDRDNYVWLEKQGDNVNYGKQGMPYGNYDFGSIMHYPVNTQLTDRQIIHSRHLVPSNVGKSETLSAGDIAAAKYLYQQSINAQPNPQRSAPASAAALAQTHGLLRKPQWIVLTEKADHFFLQQDYDRAFHHYQAVLDEYDGSLEENLKINLNNQCGQCCFACGNYQAAITWFHAVLKLNPNNQVAQNNYELAQQQIQKTSECTIL